MIATFNRAKAQAHVEVGCIGGLGWTGVLLACMAVLAGVSPKDGKQIVMGRLASSR